MKTPARSATVSVRATLYLVKVGYDLVEETQALQALLIDIGLGVELFEVGDGGEHHTHRLVRLMIKVLVTSEREITARRVCRIDRALMKVTQKEDLRAVN